MSSNKNNTPVPQRTSEEEYAIMNPDPVVVEINGKEIEIYPLPDFAYQKIVKALTSTTKVFVTIAEVLQGAEGNEVVGRLANLAPVMGDVLEALIPDSTQIIAAATKVPVAVVEARMRLLERTRVLRAVIEAERIPELLGEVKALSEQFKSQKDDKAEVAQPEAESEV